MNDFKLFLFSRSSTSLASFRTLRTVETTTLTTLVDTLCIERTADDMVADTWEILHTTTTDEDDRVLLEIMTFAGDVADRLLTVRETHFRDLSQGGVWFFRSHRVDLRAHATFLRTGEGKLTTFDRVLDHLEDGRFTLADLVAARLTDQLINGSHTKKDEDG